MKTNRNLRVRAQQTDGIILASAPAEQSFDLRAASLVIHAADGGEEKKGPRKFTMNAYNGGPMDLAGWYRPVVVDLTGIKGADKSRPALLGHDTTKIVGHTTSIKVGAKGIDVEGLISGGGEAAKEVLANHDNGFPWQVSIGAKATNVERVEEGSTATVNGKSYAGPVNIARQCVLGEVSFVPLGADDSTSARIAAEAADGVSMTFEQWLKAKGFALADINDQQKSTLEAAYKAENKDAPADKKPEAKVEASATTKTDGDKKQENIEATAVTGTVDEYRKEIAAERKRVAAIDKAAAKHPDIAAKAIEENWTLDKVELEVLRASRPSSAPYANTGAGMTSEVQIAAMSAAVARSAGVSEKVAFDGVSDAAKQLACSKGYRGAGLHQVMLSIAAMAGIPTSAGRVDDSFIRAILEHDQRAIQAHSGGYSTMSLSGITENILNKAMLEAYGTVPSVVPDIAWETDTNDFKTFKRYRLTASGAFKPVGPAGELSNLSLQDESYSNQVATTGCVIPIGRNLLINDDMGALTQVPTLIGRQGAIARESAVFKALVGNASNFFGTGNKNYLSGAGSVLSQSSLTSAVQKFIEQRDANGDPIMLMPDRLLLPPPLYATGESLFNSQYLIAGGLSSTSSKSLDPSNNIHKGKYRPIVSPFLGAQSTVSGSAGSDTAWYLLTNPAGGMATVQIGYLRGQRTPVIERGEANFNTLGIAFRAFYDFGVALHDSRTGVLNAGA